MRTRSHTELSIHQTVLWMSSGTLTYYFSQWLMTIVIVHLADLSAAGDYALVLSLTNIFYAVALFGMRNYQVSDLQDRFSHSVYYHSRWASSLIAFSACAIYALALDMTWTRKLCFLVFMVFRVSEALMDVLQGTMQKRWRMDLVGRALIVRGVANILLFSVALWFLKALMPALIAIAVFSMTWVFVFEYPQAQRLRNKSTAKESAANTRSYLALFAACAPLLLVNLGYSLILFIPRNLIEMRFGATELGAYASISAPAMLVPTIAQYIFTPYIPKFVEFYTQRKGKNLLGLFAKLSLLIAALGAVVALVCLVLGRWGLLLLFGKTISEYTGLLMPIVYLVIGTAFVGYLNTINTCIRKQGLLLIAAIASVAVCFLSAGWLIRLYGLNGASYSLIAAQGVQIIILAIGFCIAVHRNAGVKVKDQAE